jgi:hypothetical protein
VSTHRLKIHLQTRRPCRQLTSHMMSTHLAVDGIQGAQQGRVAVRGARRRVDIEENLHLLGYICSKRGLQRNDWYVKACV